MSSRLILTVEDIKTEIEEWHDTDDQKPLGTKNGTNPAYAKPTEFGYERPVAGVALQVRQIKNECEEVQNADLKQHSDVSVKTDSSSVSVVCFLQCDNHGGLQTCATDPAVDTSPQESKTSFETKVEFDPLDQMWSCLQCSMSFSKKCFLKKHKLSHKPEQLYSCTECTMSFHRLTHLNEHCRVHTGERPFSCAECGKSFGHLKTLKNHMVVHTGEKPYSCAECGKSFGRCSRLRSHQRIHTQEKPHACELCGNRFRLLETLKRHLRIHSGEKPYSCPDCGRTFTHGHRLKSHQQIHARK